MVLVEITSQLLCKLLQSDFVQVIILSTLANNCIIFFLSFFLSGTANNLLDCGLADLVRGRTYLGCEMAMDFCWSFSRKSSFICVWSKLVLFGCSDMNQYLFELSCSCTALVKY
jgi:hypothetical protein